MPERRTAQTIAQELWTTGRSRSEEGLPMMRVSPPEETKWLVARTTRSNEDATKFPSVFYLTLHPKEQHVTLFNQSTRLLRHPGPHESFPGAVGVLRVHQFREVQDITPENMDGWKLAPTGPKRINVDMWQGLYRSSQDARLDETQRAAATPRKIADKYANWQHELIARVLEHATQHDVQKVDFSLESKTRKSLETKIAVITKRAGAQWTVENGIGPYRGSYTPGVETMNNWVCMLELTRAQKP